MDDQAVEAMKLANQLCFPLYAAARNVTSLYTPWLKPLGLTYTQYIALLALWEKDGQTVGEIGEKLMLDNGTLSPLLKKMEQAGYVERRRCRAPGWRTGCRGNPGSRGRGPAGPCTWLPAAHSAG